MEMINECKKALRKFLGLRMPSYPVFCYTLQGRPARIHPALLGRQKFRRGYFYYTGGRKF
jgi:hypothetical protein